MRQFFLALFLVLVPVVAFSGAYRYINPSGTAASPLGDLGAMRAIVSEVRDIATTGDMAAAERRITDFETAWDDAEASLRPLNTVAWGNVDDGADAVLHALRAPSPDAAEVTATLDDLLAVLDAPDAGAGPAGGVLLVSGIAVTDGAGHAIPCETMLGQLRASLAATGVSAAASAKTGALLTKATERCNADDDQNADKFSAEALAVLASN